MLKHSCRKRNVFLVGHICTDVYPRMLSLHGHRIWAFIYLFFRCHQCIHTFSYVCLFFFSFSSLSRAWQSKIWQEQSTDFQINIRNKSNESFFGSIVIFHVEKYIWNASKNRNHKQFSDIGIVFQMSQISKPFSIYQLRKT